MDSFTLGFILLSYQIVITINYIYVGSLGDLRMLSSYGVGITYYFFVFNGINASNFELTRTQASKLYYKKRYHKLSGVLMNGLFFQFLISVIVSFLM
jgi:Na+-driven multidrug efflux pump